MHYTTLGKTDLRVSRLCSGCMTFGEPDREITPDAAGREQPPYHQARHRRRHQLLRYRQQLPDGSSEEIVGRALRDFARRDEIVVATKVYYPSGDLAEGLSHADPALH